VTATEPGVLTARRAGRGGRVLMAVAAGLLAGYAAWRLAGSLNLGTITTLIFIAGIGLVTWEMATASRERVYKAGDKQAEIDALRVVALVPTYNEDETALRRGLQSLLDQTRPVQAIAVVDDGSTSGTYQAVRTWFEKEAADRGVTAHWVRQPNGGKRVAQVTGAKLEPTADIFVTVDSDTIFDPHAVEEGLAPFGDERVQSVAGTVLVTNYRKNVLTRIQELWFVQWQMVSRGSLSRMKSVMVNCGPCAFYRSEVIFDNMDDYLSETLCGKPLHASDDSLLTLYAMKRGHTVQQPTAFAFYLVPEKLSHHRRQQLRWMRGSFVRSASRTRELPLTSYAFWYHLVRWIQYFAVTGMILVLLFSGILLHPTVLLWTAAIVVVLQMVVTSPYLTLRRSDQTAGQRIAVYLMAPLVGVWQMTFMRVLRWYAMATYPKLANGWGTRTHVEVSLAA
jgi:hyaluronan synthase